MPVKLLLSNGGQALTRYYKDRRVNHIMHRLKEKGDRRETGSINFHHQISARTRRIDWMIQIVMEVGTPPKTTWAGERSERISVIPTNSSSPESTKPRFPIQSSRVEKGDSNRSSFRQQKQSTLDIIPPNLLVETNRSKSWESMDILRDTVAKANGV